MENLRIVPTLRYLENLSYDLKAGDYIAGFLNLKEIEFNDLLNFFIKEEKYEICKLLIDKRNDISTI